MKIFIPVLLAVLSITLVNSISFHGKDISKSLLNLKDQIAQANYVNVNPNDPDAKASELWGIQQVLQNLRDQKKISPNDNFGISAVDSVQKKSSGSTVTYKYTLELYNNNGTVVKVTFTVVNSKNGRLLSSLNATIIKTIRKPVQPLQPAYPSIAATLQPVYRSYNGGNGDHFYCLDPNREGSGAIGYSPEGISFCSLRTQLSQSIPLYRLWRGDTVSDHFYTASLPEANNAVSNIAYTMEGNIGYIFPSPTTLKVTNANGVVQTLTAVPLYRSFHGGIADHFYTTNLAECQGAQAGGWAYEGIAGYVFASC